MLMSQRCEFYVHGVYFNVHGLKLNVYRL